jgi:hypothetical protein
LRQKQLSIENWKVERKTEKVLSASLLVQKNSFHFGSNKLLFLKTLKRTIWGLKNFISRTGNLHLKTTISEHAF